MSPILFYMLNPVFWTIHTFLRTKEKMKLIASAVLAATVIADSVMAFMTTPTSSSHVVSSARTSGTIRFLEADEQLEAKEDVEKPQPKKKQKKQSPPAEPLIIDISKLDIRVGVISKAWEHEEADKLFCEEIDIGEDSGPRQIASGLKAHYELEDLEGQRVLVLANLKTRKLVGFPSHGMVMCAANTDGTKVEFVEPPVDAPIGERVMFDGYDGEPASENQVIKKKMLNAIFPDLKTNDSGVATYKDIPFVTSTGLCKAQNGMANAEIA